jgi:hypothetical protein
MDHGTHIQSSGPSHRRVEMGVAIGMIVFGAIVVAGSLQVGVAWGPQGPRSGFFPFYIGLIIIGTSAVNLAQASLIYRGKLFAEWEHLRQVLAVVVPATIYVFALQWLGIYVTSMVLITYFMMRLGRYSVAFAGGIAVTVMVAVYFTFERWFLVPLPKGPLEYALGL